jgi:hypothetical protein
MKRALQLMIVLAAIAAGQDLLPEPTQNPDAPYRLVRTKNRFTFLMLDTTTGMIWQVQWGFERKEKFIVPVNEEALSNNTKPGRFTLVPTNNFYNFLLLDQVDGRIWQAQWSQDSRSERFISRILFAPITPPAAPPGKQ